MFGTPGVGVGVGVGGVGVVAAFTKTVHVAVAPLLATVTILVPGAVNVTVNPVPLGLVTVRPGDDQVYAADEVDAPPEAVSVIGWPAVAFTEAGLQVRGAVEVWALANETSDAKTTSAAMVPIDILESVILIVNNNWLASTGENLSKQL